MGAPVDAVESERFLISDRETIEVHVTRDADRPTLVSAIEVSLTIKQRREAEVVLRPDHKSREGAIAVCGQFNSGVLDDFTRLVLDLQGDRPRWNEPTFANAPHRASVDHLDSDTVRITVDPDKDGTPERVWTLDLRWSFGDDEFRRECATRIPIHGIG
jgi:hypothetical protein